MNEYVMTDLRQSIESCLVNKHHVSLPKDKRL